MTDMNNDMQALYTAARARTDAAATIDGAHVNFLGRLGAIDRMVDSTALSPAGAQAERARLIEQHRIMLLSVANAPEQQLGGILNPHTPTPAASRAAQAVELVAQARSQGVILTSPAANVVEAAPREKLTGPLRSRIADLRAEVAAFLRASIETFSQA